MNVENLIVQWLAEQPELADIPVSTNVPADRPESFGAPTRTKAGDMAETVKQVIRRAVEIPQVKHVAIGSTANFPLDESTPRYQLTVDMTVQKS